MKQTEKQKEWKQNHYKNNKNDYQLKQQVRRKEVRVFIDSLKQPCVVCGEYDKSFIDFHHKDPTQKEFELGDVTRHTSSNKRILNEIDKCVSICSNHHRQLHFYELTIEELIIKYNLNKSVM